jgi:photosystem II stability/assembly factor-like uncharacterized protein
MLIVAGERGLCTLDDAGRLGAPQFTGNQFMAMASHGHRAVVSILKKGVLLTDDGGRNWTDITANLPYRDVRSLAIDPHTPSTIYAGTEPAGIFRFSNAAWSVCGDINALPQAKDWSFPVPPKIPHVRCIMVSPDDPETLYALIEVGSFLISRDGGATWAVAEGLGHDLHRVVTHRLRPNVLVAATGFDTGIYRGGEGVYRSEDRGIAWQQANIGLGHRRYAEDAIAFSVNNPELVFLAAADGIPPHWASLIRMAAGAVTGNVYFLKPSRIRRRKGADVTIHRSFDAGKSWEAVPESAQHALFDMVWALETGLSDSGGPAVYFGTTGGEVRASYDAGESWKTLANGLGAVTHLHPLSGP